MFGRIPKLPIDLVNDQTDLDELRSKIEVEWIASDFEDQQRKEMKAVFDFAAADRDAASLRAALYTIGRSEERTPRLETRYGF